MFYRIVLAVRDRFSDGPRQTRAACLVGPTLEGVIKLTQEAHERWGLTERSHPLGEPFHEFHFYISKHEGEAKQLSTLELVRELQGAGIVGEGDHLCDELGVSVVEPFQEGPSNGWRCARCLKPLENAIDGCPDCGPDAHRVI